MSNRVAALCLLVACTPPGGQPVPPAAPVPPGRSVVIVVWDGLRPDAVTAADTPNLAQLRDTGAELTDQHATYPTFTMMNAASFATGAFPDLTGFYGNVVWQPSATGHDAAGVPVDFHQPVFSEDYAVLDALKQGRPQLLLVETVFDQAHAAGLPTLALGKTGPAYLQDNARGGAVLDEKMVWPRAFATALQAAGVALPATAPRAYADGELVLGPDNGNPTEFAAQHKLADGISTDLRRRSLRPRAGHPGARGDPRPQCRRPQPRSDRQLRLRRRRGGRGHRRHRVRRHAERQ
ncbi:MAG TPA: alkaline phosphatase family protein [Kofleriaceae bacterium]|jgi:hypothetical protein|nr:alkaline phosphatase family protein [Kofleriaceae bacterium]